MLILKFGGTSVANAECLQQVAHIVRAARARDRQIVVVVSAMSGVTNALLEAANSAAAGDDKRQRVVTAELLARHVQAVQQLVSDSAERQALIKQIVAQLDEVGRRCRRAGARRNLAPCTLDAIASAGERLCAPIAAAALRGQGVAAQAIDAADVVATDSTFGEASPLLGETRARARRVLLPLVEQGIVPVVTGFIGATAGGSPTTLGRGGSDYTAGILGACLDAEEVQIWTDVDGILTADPRLVPEARTLPELSYAEAAELACFGARVLHPKTVLPAMERDIPLRILNTFNPACAGTRVGGRSRTAGGTVKALSAVKGMSLLTAEGPGAAARTLAVMARLGRNVPMLTQASSDQSICCVVPRVVAGEVDRALRTESRRDLHGERSEWSLEAVAIVAIVGAGLRGAPGVANRIFRAMAQSGVNIIAIAQGPSECNVSLVVDERAADVAICRVHREFHLEREYRAIQIGAR